MTAHAAAPELAIRLSDDEEKLCLDYGRARFFLTMAEIVLPLLVLIGLTFTGAASALLALPFPWPDAVTAGSTWLRHLEFLVVVGVIVRLTLLPIQYLKEHWLDCRFGLSCQSPAAWFWEWFCRSLVFGLVTVALLFPVVETLPWWPLFALGWIAAFLLGKGLFYDYVYYPLLSCFYPVEFLRYETFDLPGIGRKTLPVYLVRVSHKTRRANAHIRLRGEKTAIYVTDTLIDEFTDGEERVVMAHEFGHLYEEERTRAGIAQAQRKLFWGVAQLLAALLSLGILHVLAPLLGLDGVHDLSGFPLLAAMTLGLAHVFSPIICKEARRDECDADEYALAITGDVDNYVSVMRKLRRMNLEESSAHPISQFLFDTHPSYTERVHLAYHYRRRLTRSRKKTNWRGWRHIQRHGRR
jgi:STE24 endopeptidase